jgi:hypothetical protein
MKISSAEKNNDSKKMNDEEKYDFYKKGFWICFCYVLWDTFTGLGLL